MRSDRTVIINDLILTKLCVVDGQAGLKIIKTSNYLHPKYKCYLTIKHKKMNASHLILIIPPILFKVIPVTPCKEMSVFLNRSVSI